MRRFVPPYALVSLVLGVAVFAASLVLSWREGESDLSLLLMIAGVVLVGVPGIVVRTRRGW